MEPLLKADTNNNDSRMSLLPDSTGNETAFQPSRSSVHHPTVWTESPRVRIGLVGQSIASAISKFVDSDSSFSGDEGSEASEDDEFHNGRSDDLSLLSEPSQLNMALSTNSLSHSRISVHWKEEGTEKDWNRNAEAFTVKRHFRSKSETVAVPHFKYVPKQRGEETQLLRPSVNNKGARPRSRSLQDGVLDPDLRHSIRMHESEKQRLVLISAAFLMDYEASRPATLHHDVDSISDRHLFWHGLRVSTSWTFVLFISATCLCGVSYIDLVPATWYIGYSQREKILLTLLTFVPTTIFFIDMAIMEYLRNPGATVGYSLYQREITTPRETKSWRWSIPFALSLLLLCGDTAIHLYLDRRGIIWSGMLMPIAYFYIFQEARDTLEALHRIAPQVIRILATQVSLILVFAAMACTLYGSKYSATFGNLQLSFISMFELATTVVNPSVWIEIYNESRSAAIFFVLFLIFSFLYFHSLVLSVIFQSYVQALKTIRGRYLGDREDALRLAFQSLSAFDAFKGEGAMCFVPVEVIKRVLLVVRSHYDEAKIETLAEYVAFPGEHSLNYDAFRMRIPKALAVSLRSKRTVNMKTFVFTICHSVLALVNLIFVAMVTIPDKKDHWLGKALLPLGICITLFTSTDLIMSLSCGQTCNFLPRLKLDPVFDFATVTATITSLCGITLGLLPWFHMQLNSLPVTLLLTGRAIDLLRFMRLFHTVRDIVRRTKQVWRFITGPLVLLGASMHILVYGGAALWGGLIKVGQTPGITPLYDLNNFNAYSSGMLTIFNLLIGNDWHAIAAVFLTVSSPAIVFPFFMGTNLFLSCILLNVVTAFFVEAFVSKEEESAVRKLSKSFRGGNIVEVHYDVRRRRNLDMIMNNVAGGTSSDEDEPKRACCMIDMFESMAPHREQVGFLVCCQQAMARFCNASFKQITRGFIDSEMLHVIISEMHIDLIALHSDDARGAIVRKFHPSGKQRGLEVHDEKTVLEIKASLLEENPPMSLFVARRMVESTESTENEHNTQLSVGGVFRL